MFAASWLWLPKRTVAALLSLSLRRKPPRRPARSRPFLECLEERVVPQAASNNLLGGINNPTVNANPQASSTVLPTATPAQLTGVAVGTFPSISAGTSASPALGGMAAPQLVDQLYAQLAALGANSTGTFGLQNSVPAFNQGIYGFGSGTQPNQPWAPAAYNLGLANGQVTFPSMADMGSWQALGGVYRRIAYLTRPNADNDQDKPPRTTLAAEDADENDRPESLRLDEDANEEAEAADTADSEVNFRPLPTLPHAATVTDSQEATAATPAPSGKPAVPEVIATRLVRHPTAAAAEASPAHKLKIAETAVPRDNGGTTAGVADNWSEQQIRDNDGEKDAPPLESLNLPATLLLSVLTPAQLMTLIMGFPTPAAVGDRGIEAEGLGESES